MTDEFWNDHPPDDAFGVVRAILGDNLKVKSGNLFNRPGRLKKGHRAIRVGHVRGFDFSTIEDELRTRLDELDWQLVSTGEDWEEDGETFPLFAIAPVVTVTSVPPIVYHTTRRCIIPQILKQGLLPSNEARRATKFPDTAGRIHVCRKLTCQRGENDSAEWWRDVLRQKNIFSDPDWGIVAIDLSQVPAGFRIHQDMHSASGLIIDRISQLPGSAVKIVP